jgi:hypothetical protein
MLTDDLLDDYKNEETAIKAFKALRIKTGITCKKCNCEHHYWLASKQQFQCRRCRFRTTLQSGSVLEGSRLPISYFFIAVHLLVKTDYKLTLEEFQQVSGHKYYDPLYDFIKRIKIFLKNDTDDSIKTIFEETVNEYFQEKYAVE